MDITILISTYCRRTVLLDTLLHLRQLQTQVNHTIETIVIDNANTDGSADAVAHQFPEVQLIRLNRNQGACAKNHGLAMATGDLVLFLDDDSYPDAQSILRMCQHFAADENLGAAVFDVQLPDGSHECSAYPSVVIGCGSAFRRNALLQVGGLPDDFFMQAEEYDLSLRLLDAGWTIRRFTDLLVHHQKTKIARVPTRTTRLDARNNLLLICRRFPRRQVVPFAIDWMRRYRWIAMSQGRGHHLAFWIGLLQGTWRSTITLHRRQPISDLAFEQFAHLNSIQHRMRDWAERTGCRRIVLIDVGKNLRPYFLAAQSAGLTIVAIADERLDGKNWRYHGVPILGDDAAQRLSFDAAIIANSSLVHAARRFEQWSNSQDRPVIDLMTSTQHSAHPQQSRAVPARPHVIGATRPGSDGEQFSLAG